MLVAREARLSAMTVDGRMATCEGTHLPSSQGPYLRLRALMKKLAATRVTERRGRVDMQMKRLDRTVRVLTPERVMIEVRLISTELSHIVQAISATMTKIIIAQMAARPGMGMNTRSLMVVQCTDELAG